MKKIIAVVFGLLLFTATSCEREKPIEVYHPFQNHTWQRFDILKFEIPVSPSEKSLDIVLFTRVTSNFTQEALGFNVIVNTPAGEERIGEYMLSPKPEDGVALVGCKNDSCEHTLMLVREITFSKGGILGVEVENLTPRMQTLGINGIGIRLTESRK